MKLPPMDFCFLRIRGEGTFCNRNNYPADPIQTWGHLIANEPYIRARDGFEARKVSTKVTKDISVIIACSFQGKGVRGG